MFLQVVVIFPNHPIPKNFLSPLSLSLLLLWYNISLLASLCSDHIFGLVKLALQLKNKAEDRREREENEEIIGMCGLGKKVNWKSLMEFSFPTGHIQQFPQPHLSFPDFSLYIVEAIFATNGWVKLQDQSLGMLT